MIDIHPPQHAAITRREFFVHLFIVVLGILIAIGLEQSVEYFHHRHQVSELRREFETERRANIIHFDAGTAEWRRFAPLLQGNLRTLAYLHAHPGALPSQWPSRMSWYTMSFSVSNAAWKTAQEGSTLEYMPRAEVQHWASFYSQLETLANESSEQRDALFRARAFLQHAPGLEKLTPEELEKEQDLWLDLLSHFARVGNALRNFSHGYPDFKNPPTDAEFYSLFPPVPDARDVQAVGHLHQAEARAIGEIEQESDTASSQPQ